MVEYQPRFQFIFQGGGAKLAVLLAAAQAVYELSHDSASPIIVTKVSGTSAGAIAACALASRTNPALFRQYLIGHGMDWLRKIRGTRNFKSKIGMVATLLDAVVGSPIFNEAEYRSFLGDMFASVARVDHMRQLAPTIVYATDLKNGDQKRYDGSQPQDTIVDALFDSTALPFIFTNFKSSICDGGIINNFPSHEFETGEGTPIGFTFARNGQYDHSNLFRYALALMSTSMDASVSKAVQALPERQVMHIKTSISTLSFESAIQFLKADDHYDHYVDAFKVFIRQVEHSIRVEFDKAREVMESVTPARGSLTVDEVDSLQRGLAHSQPIVQLISAVRRYHQMILSGSEYILLSKTLISTCNNLTGDLRPWCDMITTREVLLPRSDVSAYMATILTDSEGVDLTQIKPTIFRYKNGIRDRAQISYDVIPMIIPDEFSTMTGKGSRNLLFFINPSLKAEENVTYKISYSLRASGVLSDVLSSRGEDFFFHKSRVDLGLLKMVFFVPDHLNICFGRMSASTQREMESRFNLGRLDWIDGERISDDEDDDFDTPPHMKLLGWKAADLRVGATVGIMASQ